MGYRLGVPLSHVVLPEVQAYGDAIPPCNYGASIAELRASSQADSGRAAPIQPEWAQLPVAGQ